MAEPSGAHLPRPTPAQQRWQACELGVLFSFDLPVYRSGGWSWEPAFRQPLDPALYRPDDLDTDQWLEAAHLAGAGYAVFTATHMGGFLQWQSEAYEYGVRQSPWRGGRGDVVADFIESCRRAGIAPGLYLSVRFNAHWQVSETRVGGAATVSRDGSRQAAYLRACERMVEELCSRYGDLVELWFDGGVLPPDQGGPDVLPIFARHQPDSVFYHSPQRADHRWAGSESGTSGDPCWATIPDVASQYSAHQPQARRQQVLVHGDPEGRAWSPAMADAPLRNHEWFWRPDDEDKLHSAAQLEAMYYRSVGRNSNLILGATPDRRGLIPAADLAVCAELGQRLRRRYSRCLAESAGQGEVLDLPLPEPARVATVAIAEEIAAGERIRQYRVEGLVPGGAWQRLCGGESVGHKRIHLVDGPEVAALRLQVERAAAVPRIRSLAAYAPA